MKHLLTILLLCALSCLGQRPALEFDGGSHIEVDGGVGITNVITIAVWINRATTNDVSLVTKYAYTINKRSYGLVITGNKLRFLHSLDGTSGQSGIFESDDSITSTGVWQHISATYDPGINTKLYLDGVEVSGSFVSGIDRGGIYDSTEDVLVGAINSTPTSFFNGSIDSPRIWNRALSADEIKQLASMHRGLPSDGTVYTGDDRAGGVPRDGLVAEWLMSDTSDTSGNGNTLTLNGDATVDPILTLDGTGDDATAANESNFDFERTDAFSVSTWFKTTATSGGFMYSKGGAASSRLAGFYTSTTGSGGLIAYLRHDFSPLEQIQVNTINNGWNDGAWHHLTVTYSGSSLASGVNIYVDNIQQSLTVVRDDLANSILTDEPLLLGSRDGSLNYNGQIDATRIYNRALSPQEVMELYAEGYQGKTGALPNDPLFGDSYTVTDGSEIYTGDQRSNFSTRTGLTHEYLFASGASNTGTEGTCDGTLGVDVSVADGILYCNSAAISGADMVSLPTDCLSFDWNTPFSVSAWVNVTNLTHQRTIIATRDGSSPNTGWEMFISTSGYLYLSLDDGDEAISDNTSDLGASGTLSLDKWYHAVVTYDGSGTAAGITTYLNNTPSAITTNATVLETTIAQNPQFIGERDNTHPFSGYMDHIKVYDYEISQQQVNDLYDEAVAEKKGSLLLSLRNDTPLGGTVSTVYDYSSYGRVGVCSNGVTSALGISTATQGNNSWSVP